MPATGTVSQVIGSTFDVEFPEDQLPAIYNAVTIDTETAAAASGARGAGNGDGDGAAGATKTMQRIRLTGEVQQHLGGGRVRAVALGSTDGLSRGVKCLDTGAPVSVPVGKET